MKATLKLLRFIPAIALLFVWGCEMESNDIRQLEEEVGTDVLVMDYNARKSINFPSGTLVAGQTMDVGSVDVYDDGTTIFVTYQTNSEWCLSEIHVHVANDVSLIPGIDDDKKIKNPKVGNFSHAAELDECTYTYTAEFSRSDFGDCYVVAAHAVVKEVIGNVSELIPEELPDQVNIKVKNPGGDSYFNTIVTGLNGETTVLDGTYDGWCIDTDKTIKNNSNYIADVYSSYEDLPDYITGSGVIEFPENLDLVNWIINQGFVGQPSGCGGTYAYGDVQRAIWSLIEDQQSTSGLGSWDNTGCRSAEIVSLAEASGEGFEPECGDQLAIILVPVNDDGGITNQITIAQITIIENEVFCTPIPGDWEETAWLMGTPFNEKGGSWAMFSSYGDCDN